MGVSAGGRVGVSADGRCQTCREAAIQISPWGTRAEDTP